jgi:hypothetical protein
MGGQYGDCVGLYEQDGIEEEKFAVDFEVLEVFD